MKKNRLKIYLAINITIVIMEAIGLTMATLNRRETTFQYYTQLSNLFLMITSIANIVCAIRVLTGKKKVMPRIVNLLSYSAICTTTVTLFVVLFVLSWMAGDLIWILTSGSMIFTHTLCPILAIVMFTCFAPERLGKRAALFALMPTIAYAIVAMTMNIMRLWYGPYPFLLVYSQPVWASIAWSIGILTGAYGIARALLMPNLKK